MTHTLFKKWIFEITMTVALLVACQFIFAKRAVAAEGAPGTQPPTQTQAPAPDEAAIQTSPTPSTQEPTPQIKKSAEERNFYEVLEDVLADFEYDLKNNEVKGLKNLAIRNIALSENVPSSFKQHLELLVTERMLKHSRAQIKQCIPCRAKQAKLQDGHVILSSSENNPAELSRIAKMNMIDNFMDVAFAYQPTGMMLSFYVNDPESGTILWSRSYNSETSRASAFRRGVDYAQIDEARKKETYTPMVMYKPTIYYLIEKNFASYVGTMGFGMRVVERYDNRKKEVGFEVNYLLETSVLSGAPTSTDHLYTGFNITTLFVHAWNFIGDYENYNSIRGSIYGAIGFTYASGYLGGLVRAGYEFRLGKHWGFSLNFGYRPSATAFLNTVSRGSVGGIEAGIGVSALL